MKTKPITRSDLGQQVLTHSRMTCFRDCPRKHYLRYELGLKAERDSDARRFGSAFHLACELADKGQPINAAVLGVEDPYEMAAVLATFTAHLRHYADAPVEPVFSEEMFDMALRNPDTGHSTTSWRLNGKIDRMVRLADGRLALMEYKTTTRDFSPGADYWMKLHLDQQLSIYIMAARDTGYKVDTILYDVTRRPALRPLKATPEESRKYVKSTGALYANQRAEDETPQEYYGRIMADIESRPDHYFARIEIARMEDDLRECAAEVWMTQLAIRQAQRTGHWFRNPNACYGNFTCDYAPICLNKDLEYNTPQGYLRSDEIHPELSVEATTEG